MIARRLLVLSSCFSLLASSLAHGDDKATVKGLLDEAKTLEAKNQWPEACSKLEQAKKLEARLVIVFRLAECHEHVGRTASAHAGFLEASAIAKSSGEKAKSADALERANKVEAKLSRLSLAIKADDAELAIKLDGVDLPKARWSEKIALDPGEHVLEASAPKKKSFETKVTLLSGPTELVTTIPALVSDATPAAPPEEPKWTEPEPPAPKTEPPPPVAPTKLSPRDKESSSSLGTVGLVVGGAGLVAVGVSTYLGFAARAKDRDADSHCNGNLCDPAGKSINEDARHLGNVGTAVFAVGAALAVTGVVLYLAAPSKKAATIAPSVASKGLGLTFATRF